MRHALAISSLLVIAFSAAGCGPPRARTTFLNSVDLVNMTDQMAASFAQDEAINARSQGDDPWVVSIEKVSNQTNQLIPVREKWIYVARLRTLLAQADVGMRHSLKWVVPPETWRAVQEELHDPGEPVELRLTPTHQMTADFYTLTNTSALGRSDAYFCRFVMFNLESGEEVWSGAYEVKRAQQGKTYD